MSYDPVLYLLHILFIIVWKCIHFLCIDFDPQYYRSKRRDL